MRHDLSIHYYYSGFYSRYYSGTVRDGHNLFFYYSNNISKKTLRSFATVNDKSIERFLFE